MRLTRRISPVAKSLARHSTITLTIDRYTHTVIGDQRQALAVLPVIVTTVPPAVAPLEGEIVVIPGGGS